MNHDWNMRVDEKPPIRPPLRKWDAEYRRNMDANSSMWRNVFLGFICLSTMWLGILGVIWEVRIWRAQQALEQFQKDLEKNPWTSRSH